MVFYGVVGVERHLFQSHDVLVKDGGATAPRALTAQHGSPACSQDENMTGGQHWTAPPRNALLDAARSFLTGARPHEERTI